jgi:hypothetical protein
LIKGGAGSGNHGHGGRPGLVGGSSSRGNAIAEDKPNFARGGLTGDRALARERELAGKKGPPAKTSDVVISLKGLTEALKNCDKNIDNAIKLGDKQKNRLGRLIQMARVLRQDIKCSWMPSNEKANWKFGYIANKAQTSIRAAISLHLTNTGTASANAEIVNMGVLRTNGGPVLVKHIIQQAKTWGVKTITVGPDVKQIKFLERYGFKEVNGKYTFDVDGKKPEEPKKPLLHLHHLITSTSKPKKVETEAKTKQEFVTEVPDIAKALKDAELERNKVLDNPIPEGQRMLLKNYRQIYASLWFDQQAEGKERDDWKFSYKIGKDNKVVAAASLHRAGLPSDGKVVISSMGALDEKDAGGVLAHVVRQAKKNWNVYTVTADDHVTTGREAIFEKAGFKYDSFDGKYKLHVEETPATLATPVSANSPRARVKPNIQKPKKEEPKEPPKEAAKPVDTNGKTEDEIFTSSTVDTVMDKHGSKGINPIAIVKIAGDGTGIWKPSIHRHWGNMDVKTCTWANREVMAYQMTQILGNEFKGLVPPTRMVTLSKEQLEKTNVNPTYAGPGSCQKEVKDFVEAAKILTPVDIEKKFADCGADKVKQACGFDDMIANNDRHRYNYGFSGNNLIFIDNGISFTTFKNPSHIERSFFQNWGNNGSIKRACKVNDDDTMYKDENYKLAATRAIEHKDKIDALFEENKLPDDERTAFWDRVNLIKKGNLHY